MCILNNLENFAYGMGTSFVLGLISFIGYAEFFSTKTPQPQVKAAANCTTSPVTESAGFWENLMFSGGILLALILVVVVCVLIPYILRVLAEKASDPFFEKSGSFYSDELEERTLGFFMMPIGVIILWDFCVVQNFFWSALAACYVFIVMLIVRNISAWRDNR